MIQSCGQLSLVKRTSRVVWLITTAMLLSASHCDNWPPPIVGPSLDYVGPTHPALAHNTTQNLADLAAASCKGGPNESAGDAAAAAAQAAADKLGDAIVVAGASSGKGWPPAVVEAMAAAAKAAALAYNQAKTCGGVPPEIPNIPHYSETFWDIAS